MAKNKEKENDFLIKINDVEYNRSEVSEDQIILANELNAIAQEMITLEAAWNKLNRDKMYRVNHFLKDNEEVKKDD